MISGNDIRSTQTQLSETGMIAPTEPLQAATTPQAAAIKVDFKALWAQIRWVGIGRYGRLDCGLFATRAMDDVFRRSGTAVPKKAPQAVAVTYRVTETSAGEVELGVVSSHGGTAKIVGKAKKVVEEKTKNVFQEMGAVTEIFRQSGSSTIKAAGQSYQEFKQTLRSDTHAVWTGARKLESGLSPLDQHKRLGHIS